MTAATLVRAHGEGPLASPDYHMDLAAEAAAMAAESDSYRAVLEETRRTRLVRVETLEAIGGIAMPAFVASERARNEATAAQEEFRDVMRASETDPTGAITLMPGVTIEVHSAANRARTAMCARIKARMVTTGGKVLIHPGADDVLAVRDHREHHGGWQSGYFHQRVTAEEPPLTARRLGFMAGAAPGDETDRLYLVVGENYGVAPHRVLLGLSPDRLEELKWVDHQTATREAVGQQYTVPPVQPSQHYFIANG